MYQSDTGSLVDVTPNRRDEHFAVFAPDYNVPADFDFLDRLPTHRFSTYVAPTRRERVIAEMARMDSGLVTHKRLHAARKGLTLEDIVALQLGPDKLETCVEMFIDCSQELEELDIAATGGQEILDPEHFDFLQGRKAKLQALVEAEFARCRSASEKKARKPRL
jgi:hypothetical protein